MPDLQTPMEATIEVGQKLWYVPDRFYQRSDPDKGNDGYEITVTKIGRRWIQTDINNIRLDISTLHADGGCSTSPGRGYATREAYREHIMLADMWDKLASTMRRVGSRPEWMNAEQMTALAALLRVTL